MAQIQTQKTVVLTVILALLAGAGCGKSMTKLTDEQKSQFNETLTSMGRPLKAAMAAKSGLTTPTTPPSQIEMASPPSSPGSNAGSDKQDPISTKMQSKLQANSDCTINLTGAAAGYQSGSTFPTPPSSISSSANTPSMMPSKFSMGATVSGANCPVVLDFSIGAKQLSDTSSRIELGYSYKVQNDEFRTLNDVDGVSMSGGMDVTKTSETNISAKIDFKGKVHSQKSGDVPVIVSGEMSGSPQGDGSGELTARFEYPQFVTELKMKGSSKNAVYTLNDETITESEFSAYLTKAFGGVALK